MSRDANTCSQRCHYLHMDQMVDLIRFTFSDRLFSLLGHGNRETGHAIQIGGTVLFNYFMFIAWKANHVYCVGYGKTLYVSLFRTVIGEWCFKAWQCLNTVPFFFGLELWIPMWPSLLRFFDQIEIHFYGSKCYKQYEHTIRNH